MPPRTLSRQEAIDALRRALLARTDEHHSICEVAGRLGLSVAFSDRDGD